MEITLYRKTQGSMGEQESQYTYECEWADVKPLEIVFAIKNDSTTVKTARYDITTRKWVIAGWSGLWDKISLK